MRMFEMFGLSGPGGCKLMPVLVASTIAWFVGLGWIVVDVTSVAAYVLFVLANAVWWGAFMYCEMKGQDEPAPSEQTSREEQME